MFVQQIQHHSDNEYQQPMPPEEAKRLRDTAKPRKKRGKGERKPQSAIERFCRERKEQWQQALGEAKTGKEPRNRTGARHALIKLAKTPAEWEQLGAHLREYDDDLVESVLREFAGKTMVHADQMWAEQIIVDRQFAAAYSAIEADGDDERSRNRRAWGRHRLIDLVAAGRVEAEEVADLLVEAHRNHDLGPAVRRHFEDVAEEFAPATTLWFRDQLRPPLGCSRGKK